MVSGISVIVPAYNAAKTISETIGSLLTQRYQEWEAIIIDDGSTDDTDGIVSPFAAKDKRIKIIKQENQGVCVARNTGIAIAQHEWLLFLDADDWISPEHLHNMGQKLDANAHLDAVVCGWNIITPEGALSGATYPMITEDMFPAFARTCAFIMHSCIVRKELVTSVGGFTPGLTICTDWDLWQRVARTSARFGELREVHAFYRMSPQSISRNANKFFSTALQILKLGFSADPRVSNPNKKYINGLDPANLEAQQFYWASWCAGLFISEGKDGRALLDLVSDSCCDMDPAFVADNLFDAIWRQTCKLPSTVYVLWPATVDSLKQFLFAFELKTGNKLLAQRVVAELARKMLRNAAISNPAMVEKTFAIRMEITEEIIDIVAPDEAERIHISIEIGSEKIGSIELPVCDRIVTTPVLKDAIAAEFSWLILEKFFQYNVYEQKEIKGDLRDHHNTWGWTKFLQQLWERDGWDGTLFYDPETPESEFAEVIDCTHIPVVEISETLPALSLRGGTKQIMLSVAGVVAGMVDMSAYEEKNIVSPQALRAGITITTGFDLCVLCVREALVGKPLDQKTTIRKRLLEAKTQKRASDPCGQSSVAVTDHEFGSVNEIICIGRRDGDFGTSSSRRVTLPLAVLPFFEGLEDRFMKKQPTFGPGQFCYCPNLIEVGINTKTVSKKKAIADTAAEPYGRSYFETIFANNHDPWNSSHPYEQSKNALTLSLLPPGKFKNALEIACAEGHFTMQLANITDNLFACDISEIALQRARERCSHLDNIRFQHLNFITDSLPGSLDLIVCSEVLYYITELRLLKDVAKKVARSILPGGYLIMAHANQLGEEQNSTSEVVALPFGATLIGEIFSKTPNLTMVREIQTSGYSIHLFRRETMNFPFFSRHKHQVERIEQPELLPGGSPVQVAPARSIILPRRLAVSETQQLPILKYQHISGDQISKPAGPCVNKRNFEQQLAFLRDAGYYSARLEDWQNAILTRKPLQGHAIALTFDGGYSDFYEHAWPLLKKYGFNATVFLTANGINIPNQSGMQDVGGEFLSKQEIIALQENEVEFGSHSLSGYHLTGLSHVEMIKEAAESRVILQNILKSPVKLFAYPYGDIDPVVKHFIGACGYTLGVASINTKSTLTDDLLSLPRIEVAGSDNFEKFVLKLS
ncbi:glycosyltransferase [Segetibacter sp. 3557_3]|uniref:trifunctional glycosyltransferase/class I SAM-dependent methyltransferase/polysaccharide deacetylase n=1 Tax=Segetibacter sp. 3557_3 TaxID=2547429 RepID=UPI0010591B08|nr:trifunctional glycosyltransferase/class I SAM-dependent methyltransferase/polysaccharide deacetylase [Segetibacter sp. 3557_3]TDH20815.1 glycosyltransferase [Segetibacter sp. 3557_3]